MTKVFIGGSRRISRLNADVKRRIDRIIEKGFPVLVGDANGVDKAVQEHLKSRGYETVEVFCSAGECRNNLGRWPVRAVATREARRDFDFYAAKDEQMAREASVGLMIWDGKSAGTLANAARLVRQHKKVVVYAAPAKQFLTLKVETDWENLLSTCRRDVREKILRSLSGAGKQASEEQARQLQKALCSDAGFEPPTICTPEAPEYHGPCAASFRNCRRRKGGRGGGSSARGHRRHYPCPRSGRILRGSA